jgi:hypothetical protein
LKKFLFSFPQDQATLLTTNAIKSGYFYSQKETKNRKKVFIAPLFVDFLVFLTRKLFCFWDETNLILMKLFSVSLFVNRRKKFNNPLQQRQDYTF